MSSSGERWREVIERDEHGREHKRNVHALGDCVIRLQDRYYVSAVDETGVGSGMYFLAELPVDAAPASLDEALNALKPEAVREAEARGVARPAPGRMVCYSDHALDVGASRGCGARRGNLP